MASLLNQGGFAAEAVAPAVQALDLATPAIAILAAPVLPEAPPDRLAALDCRALKDTDVLSPTQLAFLPGASMAPSEDEAAEFVASTIAVLDRLEEYRLSLLM